MRAVRIALTALALMAFAPAPARAEVEIGGIGGVHLFDSKNPLGRGPTAGPASALTPGLVLGARVGWLPHPRWGGELELAGTPSETKDGQGVSVPSLRLHAVYNLLTGAVRPFLVAGASGFVASPANPFGLDRDVRVAGTAGVGLRWALDGWWGVRADGRVFVLPGYGGAAVAFDRELTLGVYARFPAPPPPEERGAPIIADEDGDGLGDRTDKCPADAGPIRNFGCPLTMDRDLDGLADGDDQCPDVPGTREHGGCGDTDGDGLFDLEDRCPKKPGPKENVGCPDQDSDGDGIVDRADKCPARPETVNGFEDEDGCPDERPREEVKKAIAKLSELDFERNSARLTPGSLPLLDAVARRMTDEPGFVLDIIGHTDATGSVALNMRLSRQRAESVRDYLVKRGIPVDRLTATGKGPTEPVADNANEEGRQKNRRVQFLMRSLP